MGEGAVGKRQGLVYSAEHPQCEGVANFRCGAGILVKPVGEVAMACLVAELELRAALSLAKLHRAANRDTDAHAVLAPAVEGFPPTQQFPELSEAQALLAALGP